MEIVERPEPPSGLARMLFRLPIHLYRLRLGWLFGTRLMLLTHTGRVTGRQRQVVIEVVGGGRRDGSYVVCSGFGTRAAWYRNVLANPRVRVRVGNHEMPATAEPLGEDDGAAVMATYARRRPKAAHKLCRFMGFVVDGSDSDYREVGRRLPFVRFTPHA